LATVYGIVKQSGGSIWVYSEPGQGTSFKTVFSAGERKPLALPETKSKPRSLQGYETILVVEDEEVVRRLVCHVLRKYGYKIIEARHGEEAIAAAREPGAKFDLILTDVVMPQMSGKEMVDKLEAFCGKTKCSTCRAIPIAALFFRDLAKPARRFCRNRLRPTTRSESARGSGRQNLSPTWLAVPPCREGEGLFPKRPSHFRESQARQTSLGSSAQDTPPPGRFCRRHGSDEKLRTDPKAHRRPGRFALTAGARNRQRKNAPFARPHPILREVLADLHRRFLNDGDRRRWHFVKSNAPGRWSTASTARFGRRN